MHPCPRCHSRRLNVTAKFIEHRTIELEQGKTTRPTWDVHIVEQREKEVVYGPIALCTGCWKFFEFDHEAYRASITEETPPMEALIEGVMALAEIHTVARVPRLIGPDIAQAVALIDRVIRGYTAGGVCYPGDPLGGTLWRYLRLQLKDRFVAKDYAPKSSAAPPSDGRPARLL